MKAKPLSRSSDGSYAGSIGSEQALSAEECRKVREALSKGPKYVTQVAQECDIPQTNPKRFNELCRYIDHLGQDTLEAEMVWVDKRAGRKFIGWRLSEHGQKMLEVS
jgi:hypothetical protein